MANPNTRTELDPVIQDIDELFFIDEEKPSASQPIAQSSQAIDSGSAPFVQEAVQGEGGHGGTLAIEENALDRYDAETPLEQPPATDRENVDKALDDQSEAMMREMAVREFRSYEERYNEDAAKELLLEVTNEFAERNGGTSSHALFAELLRLYERRYGEEAAKVLTREIQGDDQTIAPIIAPTTLTSASTVADPVVVNEPEAENSIEEEDPDAVISDTERDLAKRGDPGNSRLVTGRFDILSSLIPLLLILGVAGLVLSYRFLNTTAEEPLAPAVASDGRVAEIASNIAQSETAANTSSDRPANSSNTSNTGLPNSSNQLPQNNQSSSSTQTGNAAENSQSVPANSSSTNQPNTNPSSNTGDRSNDPPLLDDGQNQETDFSDSDSNDRYYPSDQIYPTPPRRPLW